MDTHGLALVPSKFFVDRMVNHWSKLSGGTMPATPALKEAWSISGDHYRSITINNASSNPYKPSVVLPLPTGSGKTEGLCVYAALQAEANTKEDVTPVGVLIVTRLIKDADRIVSSINALAGRSVAATRHTEAKLTTAEMASADILVITHAAFMRVCKAFGAGDRDRWDTLYSWDGGKRHLVVVDEALLNAVSDHKVSSKDIANVLQAVPHKVLSEHAGAVGTLTKLQLYLDKRERDQSQGGEQMEPLWGEGSPRLAEEIEALRGVLDTSDFGRDMFVEDAGSKVLSALESIQTMLEEFAYYQRTGIKHSLNTARYVVPAGMPGIVVLDATARSNMIYELLAFGGGVKVVDVPTGIRNYSNATLHVTRTTAGTGRTKMEKAQRIRLPRLVKELGEKLEKGRRVFLCVHKGVKDLALTYSTAALPLSVGHWGAVDGSNEWSNHDVAVIFGLFWQDPSRPVNNVFAIDGPKDAAWLKAPRHGNHEDVLAVIRQKDVSTSVIQAINRICIRRVVDQQGGCAPGDIYIVLPKGWQGDAILQDIHANMPGLNQVDWDFEPDGPKVYTPRAASAANALVDFMKATEPGTMPMPSRDALGLTEKQHSRLKENLAKADSRIATTLRNMGVFYQAAGKGRAAFLVKAAA